MQAANSLRFHESPCSLSLSLSDQRFIGYDPETQRFRDSEMHRCRFEELLSCRVEELKSYRDAELQKSRDAEM